MARTAVLSVRISSPSRVTLDTLAGEDRQTTPSKTSCKDLASNDSQIEPFFPNSSRKPRLRYQRDKSAVRTSPYPPSTLLGSSLHLATKVRHEPVARKVLSMRAYEEPCWPYKSRKTVLATGSCPTFFAIISFYLNFNHFIKAQPQKATNGVGHCCYMT